MTPTSKEQLREDIVTDPFFGDAVRFVLSKLGDVRGKVIFDSGCGGGKMSVFFALQGATVIGIDKDETKLNEAIGLSDSFGVRSSCSFLLGYSEKCPIDSGSIDIIFSRSTIQYMEREKALNEYVRILKPGGSIALVENLPYNPFINLYRIHRKLTARTQQQREYVGSIKGYITPNDIDRLRTKFRFVEQRQYHLFRMASIYLKRYLKGPPGSTIAQRLDSLLSNIDDSLLTSIPFLRKLAWFVAVIIIEKIQDNTSGNRSDPPPSKRCCASPKA
jgi:ubiquinone/menaquinone biosynthesis C-methylase UbiE